MAEGMSPGRRPGTLRRRPGAAERPVARSIPIRLEIPAIDLRAGVVAIGLRPDGNLDVPPQPDGPVAWYERSPTPGELGSAVLVGHVDAAHDVPAVFARLRLVRPGDAVSVGRADRGVIRFVVTGIARYPKDHFPGERLLGPRDYPALTMMTCGGIDQDSPGHHSNLIVFARRAAA
jgi:sortase (surface protein transpeptidase)